MALFVRNGGSRHTGQVAPPQRNNHIVLVNIFVNSILAKMKDICYGSIAHTIDVCKDDSLFDDQIDHSFPTSYNGLIN